MVGVGVSRKGAKAQRKNGLGVGWDARLGV